MEYSANISTTNPINIEFDIHCVEGSTPEEINGPLNFPFIKWRNNSTLVKNAQKYLPQLRNAQSIIDTEFSHEDILRKNRRDIVYDTPDHKVALAMTFGEDEQPTYLFIHFLKDVYNVMNDLCELTKFKKEEFVYIYTSEDDNYIVFLHLKKYSNFLIHTHSEFTFDRTDIITPISGSVKLVGSTHPDNDNFQQQVIDLDGTAIIDVKKFHTGYTTVDDTFIMSSTVETSYMDLL